LSTTDATASAPDPAYSELPKVGPYDVEIGGALITMVEPHLGHEIAYNRWYEDDHFYSGAMAMPWMFAGKRFVATRDLQLLRYPEQSVIAQPVTAGCYLHLYWITRGRMDDHIRWTSATNYRLRADDRILLERTHIYTSFQDYLGGSEVDPSGPRDIHSLDRGYPGVVMEVIDAHPGTSREALDAWLVGEYLPWVQRPLRPGSASTPGPVAQTLRFAPQPLPADKQPDVADIPGVDRRVTLVHFLTEDPRLRWMTRFSRHGARVDAGGLGRMELCAPFVAVEHGTNRYVDELRDES
jgi:hypothetical protein